MQPEKNKMDFLYLDPVTLQESESLYFVLTPYSGDADMYISCNTCPSLDENNNPVGYQWESTADDLVVIAGNGITCGTTEKYCVGVKGHTASDYGILAYVSGDEITLTAKYSLSAAIKGDEHAYFKFTPEPNANFTVSVTPIVGYPDLYIKVDEKASKDNFDWKSLNFGFDVIEILPSDDKYKSGAEYHMAVHGFGAGTLFVISVDDHEGKFLGGWIGFIHCLTLWYLQILF